MTQTTNPLLALGLLQAKAPKTVAGFRRWRQIIDSDGAIPAPVKRLFVACAATVKGYEDMARRELAAAKAAGLSEAEAGAAVAILASVRGEGASLRYHGFFREIWPEAQAPEPGEQAIEVAPGEAEANFLQYFGTMPPSLGKLFDLVPLGADAYYLMREGTLSGTALDPAHAELLLVTVLSADYSSWTSVHMQGARKAGASEAAVAEAVICAVPTAGLSAWVVGATAMDS
ncbi:carboxymuconolactone decarboxylase family protein [Novosphingobium rosa]|uniref:carboxymuconolactone decarboxylase family protein n=1 Tax=Novosphingobium rosa TaxID=76978 RepID=UPI001FE0F98D|nr:carboxymuconolactone decarboxylase family protein [Novosphingobium rosa]